LGKRLKIKGSFLVPPKEMNTIDLHQQLPFIEEL
jgi:hypothetical protein